jgi:hypothetical protein
METKAFIGSGKQVQDMDIIDVTISMDTAQAHIFEYEGKKYLRFSVARRKEVSNFGRTHTVTVFTPKPKAKKQPRKAAKK